MSSDSCGCWATPPAAARAPAAVRVLGIDDWSWRKGVRYGSPPKREAFAAGLVDLERRQVVDVLPVADD